MPKILWSSQQAREMSVKAHAARRQKRAARKIAEAALTAAPPADPSAPDPYLTARLACVRQQLARVDEMLLAEKDAQRLDRLAAASSKLSEVERQLAGRPAPGAYRPTTPRRRTVEAAPLIPE